MGLYHSPRIVTNGLVLALDAADRNSYPTTGTTWFDLSGNENNGTLINGVGYTGSNCGTLVFDGTNDYATCADSNTIDLDNTVGFTVSFFNYRTSATQYQGYVGRGDNYGFQIYGDADPLHQRIEIAKVAGGYNQFISNTTTFPLNTWSFTCMRYNAQTSTLDFFQNSTKRTFTSGVGGSGVYALSTNQPLFIGWANYSGRYFGGQLNNISLYNIPLSDTEIQQNFNALRGRFGI
jgi:hypothetical protein